MKQDLFRKNERGNRVMELQGPEGEMLSLPKSSVGLMIRKGLAFILAYCFFATSVWSLALPMEKLPGRYSGGMISSWAVRELLKNKLLTSSHTPAQDSLLASAATGLSPQKVFTNFAELNAAATTALQGSGGA